MVYRSKKQPRVNGPLSKTNVKPVLRKSPASVNVSRKRTFDKKPNRDVVPHQMSNDRRLTRRMTSRWVMRTRLPKTRIARKKR